MLLTFRRIPVLFFMFSRTEYILGTEGLARLKSCHVIIFGVGGVGSWCAEGLVRTGVGHLTLVDPDVVVTSNINRQLPATSQTIGRPKVEVMKERLLQINPEADIQALQLRYSADNEADFHFQDFDYVIDAIDSLADKALLIRRVTEAPRSTTLFSSMGAARKWDPSQVRVAEFWQAKGCPLAAALRHRFKKSGLFPARKFKVVYSPEVHPNVVTHADANGSLVHITSIWGMTLASLVIRHRLGL